MVYWWLQVTCGGYVFHVIFINISTRAGWVGWLADEIGRRGRTGARAGCTRKLRRRMRDNKESGMCTEGDVLTSEAHLAKNAEEPQCSSCVICSLLYALHERRK